MSEQAGKQILLAGCLLALLAGAVNAVFLLQTGTSVSHLTGDGSRVASSFFSGEGLTQILPLTLVVVGFIAGAAMAGFWVHHQALGNLRLYGVPVAAIGILLSIAWFLLPMHTIASLSLAAIAMGYQNALANRYRGVILRTTHVTGLLTDLGVLLGMRARGSMIPSWKIAIPLFLSCSFLSGAILGAWAFIQFGRHSLLACALVYLTLAMVWRQRLGSSDSDFAGS